MSQVLSVTTPDDSEFRQAVAPLIAAAKSIKITCPEEHATAQEAYRNLRLAEKKADDLIEPARAAIEASKKAVLKIKDDLKAPITAAKEIVGAELSRYEAEQRAIALEKQRVLEQQERLRQQEQRLLAEEAAAKAKSEQEAKAAQAEVAEAEKALAAPVQVSVAPSVAKVSGIGTRTTHEAVVDDLAALVQHAAAHPEIIECLLPNMPQLNFMARKHKQALALPGVRVVEKIIRSVR